MFSTRLDRMEDSCVQLERQMLELEQLHIELESVIRSLSSLSGMDDLIVRLSTQKSCMGTESQGISQMMRGLDKITVDYMSCENRICDNGEQSIVRFVRKEVGVSDLGKVSNMLGNISFI